MRKLMENQLSWFALFMTAFYSLLASCRGEKCSHEELTTCTRPLKKIGENSFILKKEELQELCPNLEAGMKCIKKYTINCMEPKEREDFYSIYTGTNQVIMELCQEGPYQEEFLRHAPCMQKVKNDYELCYKRYKQNTDQIERQNGTKKSHEMVKSLCCAFNEYSDCCHHVVRRKCGEEAARFTKEVLDRMSNSLQKRHCSPFKEGCSADSGSTTTANTTWNIEVLVSALLIFFGRYFT